MLTLQCRGCGRQVCVNAPDARPARCPHCQAALPSDADRVPVPSWFPVATPAPDTGRAADQPTQVTGAPVGYPFLGPPRGPDEIGWLGSYRVLRVLGQGGMGVVFEAEDTQLERRVALKVMASEAARDPAARKRFLREARLTAALHSDHIITIHAVGEINETPYLAMELLRGETLASWMRHQPRPGPAQVLDLAAQLTRGLEVAHAAGLVHRDIKPANLWVEEPSGRVKLLDFGLARLSQAATGLTQVGMVLGTPAYMAPEQAEGATVDGRSDLFSLGCVLYEFATGAPPFVGNSAFAILAAMAAREPVSLHTASPGCPRELSALVMRLLRKDPAGRPTSAAAVTAGLIDIADANPALRPAWLSGARPSRGGAGGVSRRAFWIAGAAGVAALAGGGLYLYSRLGKQAARGPRATAPGVSEDRVLFGMSGPLSGPTAELGRGVRAGIETYFKHANERGGVAGRRLELVALDDGYDPDRALANVGRLREEFGVFGFVGNVGAPTAAKTAPYALEHRMLFFGAFTGASGLRKTPPDRYVFNYRAGLEEETAAVVKYLTRKRSIRLEEIAVFSQDDEYGASGFRGVERALGELGRRPEQIVHVRYPRNTVRVEPAVAEVLKHEPIKAVVMAPTYRPAALFIRQLRRHRPKVLFSSTAFVGSAALAEALKEAAAPEDMEGVIVTQTVPPADSQSSLVINYRDHLRRYAPAEAPGSVSLEGYVAAAVLAEGLRRAGEELTSESLVEALESIRDFDLGLGPKVNFGPSAHQAVNKVWGIELDKTGRYRPLELD